MPSTGVRRGQRRTSRKTSIYGPPVPESIKEANAIRTLTFSDVGGFIATAYGPPWGGIEGEGTTATGVNLKGDEPAYIVAVDPGVIPLHSKLKIWPNPFNNRDIVFSAEDTGGAIRGRRIDFYDWRGRDSQNAWGRRAVQVKTAGLINDPTLTKGSISVPASGGRGGGSNDGSGGGGSSDGGGILGWADAVGRLVTTMLDASKWGPLLSDVTAFMLRSLVRSLWKYLIAPPWHWTERATQYYWEQIMSGRSGNSIPRRLAGIITATFWGVGWVVLFTRADNASFGTSATNTPLGRTAQGAQLMAAKRKLHSPRDVARATPKKPPVTVSSVPLTITRRFSTIRKRTVRVTERGSNAGARDTPTSPSDHTQTGGNSTQTTGAN